ncbi:CopG family nickel-responsive transcriptional regulator [Rhodobium orientis]|uniref:Putative nickel-responsive regulator n=1 Tax=Rhodobium orientis TaxID=34017 RepID=A0A327JLB8_9HYPH|nr:nickel-responsive transcriptional regulator NikR [Rhodobium orientis]MBB4301935.1 CopG family nickel-responsive transcriptional regulator [Rhodobium orientis]MBK5950172.1 nickel-responsive transcriptional regulator NikR [Rhodobium orientis]RAI27240.1 nickel-responsive transcriptional regulator NikR [Rhodobium orientis]
MARVTISIDDDLLEKFDVFIAEKGYETRSEGVRDAVRQLLADEEVTQKKDAPCVGCVTYVYSHRERTLSSRLVETQHHHHDIPTATLHVHIDPETCLETTVLRGTVAEVEDLADRITSQTGVRHGRLHVIPVETPKHEKHET